MADIDPNSVFADIQSRWTDLDGWGLRNRPDLSQDVAPWNLKYPPVSDRIKRWDAFRTTWIGSAPADRSIEDLYQAAADVTVTEWAARRALPDGFQADAVWHPISLPPITDVDTTVFGSCARNALMHVNITPEAEASVAQLRGRWKDLMDWGVRIKLPQNQDKINRWDQFTCKWNYDPEIGELDVAASDLQNVEDDARDLGYKADRPAAPPVTVPSVEEGTYGAKVTTGVEEAGAKAKKALGGLPGALADLPWLKIGAGVGVGLIALGLLGVWAARSAAPYALPMATGMRVREREPEGVSA